jgi:mono/diheme cytochrome c family protein
MKLRLSYRLAFGSALLQAGIILCSQSVSTLGEQASAPAATGDLAPLIRSIDLPHLEPELALAPGRNEFMEVCVSCHSPRYVQMQPPFAQRQWQDTVDKMAKTYGASMDAEQRTAIIGYLVATHGPNSAVQPAATDDEDFAATPVPLSPLETAPSLSLPLDSTELAAEVNRGENLFVQNCAGCHGVHGRGDGWVAPVLFRKPKNLATTRFSLTLLSQVLWNGKPGTAMPSWRSVPPANRAALAAYVQSLHAPAKAESAPVQVLETGSSLFRQNCAPCHGEAGDGNGPNAATLLPRPANFKLKQPDSDYLLQILNDGIPGTAMPSWKDQIAAFDREALAAFVRSLFETTDSKR